MATNQPNSTKKKAPTPESYVRYASMGTQMLVIIGLGVFGGYYLDHSLGLKFPVFTIVLSLLSIAAALYFAIKDFLQK